MFKFGKSNVEVDAKKMRVLLNSGSVTSSASEFQLQSDVIATATTIVSNRTPLWLLADGFWVAIDPWTSECEIRKVTTVAGSTLTVAALSYAHSASDPILFLDAPTVNANWFGALGDGTTDDLIAFDRALVQVGGLTNGGKLLVTGTHSLSGTWVINQDNVVIELSKSAIIQDRAAGSYTAGALITFTTATNSGIIGLGRIQPTNSVARVGIDVVNVGAENDLTFADFTLEDWSFDLGGSTYTGYGLRFKPGAALKRIICRNLVAIDCWVGYQVKEATSGTDIQFIACNAYAITHTGDADRSRVGIDIDRNNPERIQIIGGLFTTALWGIAVASSSHIKISNVTCDGQTGTNTPGNIGQGIHLESTAAYGDLFDISIINPTIKESAGHGIVLNGPSSAVSDTCKIIKIFGGLIYQPGLSGVYTDVKSGTNNFQNITVSGLTIQGDQDNDTNAARGIHFVDCENSSIVNCEIFDIYKDGILATTCTDLTQFNNRVWDCNWEDSATQAGFNVSASCDSVVMTGNYAYYENRTTGNLIGYYFYAATDLSAWNNYTKNATLTGEDKASPYLFIEVDSGKVKGSVIQTDTGSPEGAEIAKRGAIYLQTDGTRPCLWTKESGTGNTGWRSSWNMGTPTERTISGGVIGLASGEAYTTIDTQNDDATDDLDTITATASHQNGDLLILRNANNARTVVCKDGAGNLRLSGDRSLTNINDRLLLLYNGTNWLEVSFADND